MNADIVALFRRLTQGVYVIGVAHGEQRDAFTAASLMQLSYRPLLLALAINPAHASYAILRKSHSFAASVLDRTQLALARHFGTPSKAEVDKMQGFAWRRGERGAPILERALAYFDCELQSDTAAGDHRLIVARVVGGSLVDAERTPLRYQDTEDLDHSAALYPDRFSA